MSNSPWGKIDQTITYMTGFNFVSTSSHGGFRVTKRVLNMCANNADKITKLGGIMLGNHIFFEEDSAFALVLLDAPDLLKAYCLKSGKNIEQVRQDCCDIVKFWYKEYFDDITN